MDDYDIKVIDRWSPPEENDVRLLGMPNVPHGLFRQAPRVLLGQAWWDKVRKECYERANHTCEVCGKLCTGMTRVNAHEVYEYDFKTCKAKFVRPVCLCPSCHQIGCHNGRNITLFKKGDEQAYSRIDMIGQASRIFKLINAWNLAHHNEEPIRVSTTFLEWAKTQGLTVSMPALFETYDVKFAQPYESKKWAKWTLEVGNDIFESPYKTREEWEHDYPQPTEN